MVTSAVFSLDSIPRLMSHRLASRRRRWISKHLISTPRGSQLSPHHAGDGCPFSYSHPFGRKLSQCFRSLIYSMHQPHTLWPISGPVQGVGEQAYPLVTVGLTDPQGWPQVWPLSSPLVTMLVTQKPKHGWFFVRKYSRAVRSVDLGLRPPESKSSAT